VQGMQTMFLPTGVPVVGDSCRIMINPHSHSVMSDASAFIHPSGMLHQNCPAVEYSRIIIREKSCYLLCSF